MMGWMMSGGWSLAGGVASIAKADANTTIGMFMVAAIWAVVGELERIKK